MAIPTTTVDKVKDYLVVNITSQLNDSTVLVMHGTPGLNLPDDVIAVGELIDGAYAKEAFVGSGGQHWLHEHYRMSVVISCYRGGEDQQGAFKRARALADAIDTMIRNDPTLGANVLEAYPSTFRWQTGWEAAHKGVLVEVHKELEISAEV